MKKRFPSVAAPVRSSAPPPSEVPEGPSVLEAALALHDAGWWVVPQAGKRSVAYGWGDFRLSEDDVRTYFSDERLNVGVALHQSPCIDVECDGPEAEAELLRRCGGEPPATPTWRSRRGLHRLFLRPEGCPDKAVAHAGGVEFRLGRGRNPRTASTLPPSVHPDSGTRYEWLPGLSLDDVEPAALPPGLLALLNETPRRSLKESSGHDDGEIAEGGRNDELFRLGCRALSNDPGVNVADLLAGANKRCRPPLEETEVESIVRSVLETSERSKTDLMPLWCDSWEQLEAAWREALEWRSDMADVLSVMLSVAASTVQTGDQLFLQVVGDPGTAKTRFCDAMLVSRKCKRLEKAKGFFSGVLDPKDPKKDYSFIARANRCCLITPEADIFMSAPGAMELMSEQRRIFDGSASTSFKNRDEDTEYQGLRTPWVMAGTPAMFDGKNQGHLGDRFLRVRMGQPDEDTKARILVRVGRTAWDAVCQESNCSPESVLTSELRLAYRLTGGYVEWLRANVTSRLLAVRGATDCRAVDLRCAALADFTAFMRSRPPDRLSYFEPDHEPTKELPSRLQAQFVRLSACLAVVLNLPSVEDRVLGLVRRVALDTARGRTLTLTGWLAKAGRDGTTPGTLAVWARESDERVERWLAHMEKVGAALSWIPHSTDGCQEQRRWRLSDRVATLYEEIVRAPAARQEATKPSLPVGLGPTNGVPRRGPRPVGQRSP